MLEKVAKSPFLHKFKEALTKEPSLVFEGLWDCPKTLLAKAASDHLQRSVVIISGEDRKERLLDDLQFFSPEEPLDFLAWETLPSEEISPSLDIVGRRFEILYKISQSKTPHLIVSSLQAILQKVIPKEVLVSSCQEWKIKKRLSFSSLPSLLETLGYQRSSVTSDKGYFSVRGGILDIFPSSSTTPYRIEFFDDEIDRIRSFDPVSQKSQEKVSSFFLSPAGELPLIKNAPSLTSFLSYFSKPPIIILDDLLCLEEKWVALKNLPGMDSRFFFSLETLLEQLPSHKTLYFSSEPLEKLSDVVASKKRDSSFYSGELPLQHVVFEMFHHKLSTQRMQHPFAKIEDFFLPPETLSDDIGEDLLMGLTSYKDHPLSLFFMTSSDAEEALLKKQLQEFSVQLPADTHFLKGYLTSGCVFLDCGKVFFPFTELSHRYKVRRKKWRNATHTPASDFHELCPGDLVVHFHNGIGKFLGIEKQKNHLGHVDEFLILEYASSSKLYVPLSQSHLISRYIGIKEDKPPLHTLGTTKWQVAKAKAQESIAGYAKDLLQMQAQREAKGGFSYPQDGEAMLLFEEEFPFTETEDQLKAISAIKEDMTSLKAMDRLICGDVGYGKTEVAMRAAFKAVVDGKKQVAVLVPTTTLAMQHYDTFMQRMANFPIRIRALSRFISAKEAKKVLEELKEGSVDILIGTHRLISKDVAFHSLGLLIIDEEHRFGVRAKETLKKIKVGVDCLYMSATPIPRTLHMSMVGIKDLSVINTPPQDRLPIKTILAESDDSLIKNALLRELSRDGQAYYIHNRVETLHEVREDLQALVPTAKIKSVNGQMDPEEIDEIFHAFKSGAIDILVATTIIESGIDIPNANTILIDRADCFGLADLYQLRGRVGRWNRPAYAYFLTKKNRELPELSRKRLQALVETSGLGGGMKLAMRDLEIRGAGDLLGIQQSGQVSSVGFHLYCKLLKRSIDSIKKKTPAPTIETKMEFTYYACLPESYILETSLRLDIYHRLGDAVTFEDLDEIFKELEDRFGKPPEPVIWLHHLNRMRLFASSQDFVLLKFEKLTFTAHHQNKDKTLTKKTIPLPHFDLAQQLEDYVCLMLRHHFKL